MRWSRGARLVAAAFLAAAGAVGLAAPAHAEQINRFTVEARVDADSSLHLVETITYDFQGEYRHGIFRDIPLYDDLGLGKRREYGIEVGYNF